MTPQQQLTKDAYQILYTLIQERNIHMPISHVNSIIPIAYADAVTLVQKVENDIIDSARIESEKLAVKTD